VVTMTRRSSIDRARVRDAIVAAERTTSAQIVVSIAPFFIGSVQRAAQRAFTRLHVAASSVLVFVVPARHQAIVLGDDATVAGVSGSIWQEVASIIASELGNGRGTNGLIQGVARLGAVLSAAFPHADDAHSGPS